jgi:hypothetical protein
LYGRQNRPTKFGNKQHLFKKLQLHQCIPGLSLTIFPKLYKVRSSFLDISSFAKKILEDCNDHIFKGKIPAVFAHIFLFILVMILLLPSVIVFSQQENKT